MERAEVLRGPQNTLFGRNTTGGAVNFISTKPRPEDGTNGYLRGGVGSYSQIDIEGAIGFALGENAALRISGVSNTRDGVFDSLSLGQEVGDQDRQAVRAQLAWQPNDSWDVLFRAYAGQSDAKPFPFKNVGFLNPNDIFSPCAVPVDNLIPQNNPNCADSTGFVHRYEDWEDTYNGLVHSEDVDTNGFSLRVDWSNDLLSLTSITALDYLEVKYQEDSDGGPTTVFQFYQEGEYDQWSQEFRLASADDASLRWIAGMYYFFEDAQYSTAVRRTPAPYAPSGPDRFNIVPNTQVQQDNEAISVFGQVDFDLTDDLTLTTGLRWTNETKKGSNAPSVRCVGTVGGPPFCPSFPEDAFVGADDVA
ncbi:MAG: TonB-dependent receptor domain-containing protein, partial [Luminiphilus sp.]